MSENAETRRYRVPFGRFFLCVFVSFFVRCFNLGEIGLLFPSSTQCLIQMHDGYLFVADGIA